MSEPKRISSLSYDMLEQIVALAPATSLEVSYLTEEEKTRKQPSEFCVVSPLESKSKNKAECTAGCWLESVMKTEEKKKMKERRERPVGLEEPSGLTVGPSLIGRPVRAWMTTKQD